MSKLTPGKEYERKFLVRLDKLPRNLLKRPQRIIQGFLAFKPAVVRIRIIDGREAVLEIKGINDDEFAPMHLPIAQGRRLMTVYAAQLAPPMRKVRYAVPSAWKGLVWEVDFFKGENAPLVVAEIETPTKRFRLDPKKFPPWIGQEVTDDPRYKNKNLILQPYSTWR